MIDVMKFSCYLWSQLLLYNRRLMMRSAEEEIRWFRDVLPRICDRETSMDPDRWTPENPLHAHCSVVSLLAHDIFGGEIIEASIEQGPGFERRGIHYWNKLSNGREEDFTKGQFKNDAPIFNNYPSVRTRAWIFQVSPVAFKRYMLLCERFFNHISNGRWQRCYLKDPRTRSA